RRDPPVGIGDDAGAICRHGPMSAVGPVGCGVAVGPSVGSRCSVGMVDDRDAIGGHGCSQAGGCAAGYRVAEAVTDRRAAVWVGGDAAAIGLQYTVCAVRPVGHGAAVRIVGGARSVGAERAVCAVGPLGCRRAVRPATGDLRVVGVGLGGAAVAVE